MVKARAEAAGSRRWHVLSRLDEHQRRRLRVAVIVLLALALAAWAVAPAVRAVTLVGNRHTRSAPDAHTASLPIEEVHFTATDGVHLAGWLAVAAHDAPTIILVHGFKGSRTAMLPWARFLFAAGYNVLLYDSRGCGASAGWSIGLGATEPRDVIGAARYLAARSDLRVKQFGALGVSLGAGEVLLAAAREPSLVTVVADSAWTDEHAQLDRMGSLPLGPLAVPALPYEPTLVDALIGAHLADARPLNAIPHIAPRAVLLIASADDANTTTPLAGTHQLYAAAGQPKDEWIAPSGGHAGALFAHPVEYKARVLAFFSRYLETKT